MLKINEISTGKLTQYSFFIRVFNPYANLTLFSEKMHVQVRYNCLYTQFKFTKEEVLNEVAESWVRFQLLK